MRAAMIKRTKAAKHTTKRKGRAATPAATEKGGDDVALQERIDFALGESEKLRETLAGLANTFENVKAVIRDLVSRGLTILDADTLTSVRTYDERLAELCVETIRFTAVLETTYTKPVMPTPIQQIDPASDQALIIRELIGAAKAISETRLVLSETTTWRSWFPRA